MLSGITSYKDQGPKGSSLEWGCQFDSMGHSAKYGVYTMFCNTTLKVVYFELLKVGVDPQIFHSHNEKLFNCDPPWDFSE